MDQAFSLETFTAAGHKQRPGSDEQSLMGFVELGRNYMKERLFSIVPKTTTCPVRYIVSLSISALALFM